MPSYLWVAPSMSGSAHAACHTKSIIAFCNCWAHVWNISGHARGIQGLLGRSLRGCPHGLCEGESCRQLVEGRSRKTPFGFTITGRVQGYKEETVSESVSANQQEGPGLLSGTCCTLVEGGAAKRQTCGDRGRGRATMRLYR